jgi:hypothetical protein
MLAAKEAIGLEAVLEARGHWHEMVAGGVVATIHDLKYAPR